ncbi:MAG: hypothetical protein J6A28_04555 [Clostridia bacterium]|nr:hypothetical protein [Clostridia bacterium]
MEEIKFKNTSKLNAEEISLFQGYAMKKTIWAMSIFFLAIFAALGVGLAFVNLTLGIILIACGVAGSLFFLPYLLRENQKRQNLQRLGSNKYLNTFTFYDSSIVVESEVANEMDNRYHYVGQESVKYEDLFKVVTYKDRVFLFLNPAQSLIVNFNGMTTGTIADHVNFLKEKGITIIDKSHIDTTPKKK